MKTKKSPKANLENKKFIFLQIGFILALTAVFLSFEWKSYEINDFVILKRLGVGEAQIEIIQTKQEIKPPPLTPPQITTIINTIDDDDIKIDGDIEIDAGADENTINDEYIPDAIMPDDIVVDNTPFMSVESMPEFPGGEIALMKYLANNISYPKMANENNIHGKVFITFVVETDGSISNIELLRGIGGGCDEEAIRVVKNMPRWIPGKQRNKAVRVQFNLPVKFTLL